jgi:hypothetical protein
MNYGDLLEILTRSVYDFVSDDRSFTFLQQLKHNGKAKLRLLKGRPTAMPSLGLKMCSIHAIVNNLAMIRAIREHLVCVLNNSSDRIE